MYQNYGSLSPTLNFHGINSTALVGEICMQHCEKYSKKLCEKTKGKGAGFCFFK